MKVTTVVECTHEVDVEIDKETLLAVFTTSPELNETWLSVLNRFAMAMNTLPDSIIATWAPSQHRTIRAFLAKQAARFTEGMDPQTVENPQIEAETQV